jgi:16S rRNA processing protein RimM
LSDNNFPDDLIEVGTFARPHGIKGFICINFYNNDSRLLKINQKIYVKKEDCYSILSVEMINYNHKIPILKLYKINDRDTVNIFKGSKLYLSRSEFPDIPDGDYYLVDLIHCKLLDEDENLIGKIIDVLPIKNNELLLIETINGEKMVPLIKDSIKLFDKKNGILIMNIIDGLVD